MNNTKHLKNAPITEALIDIQFEPIDYNTVLKIKSSGIEDKYPTVQPIRQADVSFKVGEGFKTSTESTSEDIGFRFDSPDSKFIAQFRKNGFTLSRLSPYERWEDIKEEARRLWEMYRENIVDSRIKRLGVRYINKILLPSENLDLSEYFNNPPVINSSDSQLIKSFLQRLVVLNEETNVTTILHLVNETSDGELIPVVLDIDSFLYCDYASDDTDIWAKFEILRDQKNNIFYNSITAKTEELCS